MQTSYDTNPSEYFASIASFDGISKHANDVDRDSLICSFSIHIPSPL